MVKNQHYVVSHFHLCHEVTEDLQIKAFLVWV